MSFIISFKIILLTCCFISALIGIKIGEYFKAKEFKNMLTRLPGEEHDKL